MKCIKNCNMNKCLFHFVYVMLILFILAFHQTDFLGSSFQLNKFYMKIRLPLQDTQCPSWDSNNRSEQTLPKFIRNTNLFLTIDGDWWQKPNYLFHTLPYGIKGNEAVVKKILIRTQSNMPDEIDRLNCKRCVIVGNGNTLRNSSLGDTINKYDVVIRLNNAPVRGYENDVGNKTTLRIFYPESVAADPRAENNPDTLFVLVPFKTADIQWLKAIVYNETKVTSGFWRRPAFVKNLDPAQVRLLNPFYMYQAAAKLLEKPDMIRWRRSHPTTGFLAITLGLNYCDEIHVAGFGYPLNQTNGLIHYFDRLYMRHMSKTVHNVSHEGLILKKLRNAGIIKYLTAAQ
ncbi:CMP-N-acetylneuraminate-beta-galactosamide-alpha-2,3-sialyltransferase 4-like [Mustelus asterias]